MNIDDCVHVIKSSKKYSLICDQTIIRIVKKEAEKHKSEKDIIKSAKTKLHQISGVFIGEDSIRQVYKLMETLHENNVNEVINKILSLHASSTERMNFIGEMYNDIFLITGNEGSVLDIACGFNPFYIPCMSISDQGKYYAADINIKIIDLLNCFFSLTGINGHAFANDVLYKTPDVPVHNVFLFKIIPLLEQQQKGFTGILIDQLRSDFFTVTFPTKTLSGKNVGMYQYYDEFMKNRFAESDFEYCFQKEYFNELLYIIKRRK